MVGMAAAQLIFRIAAQLMQAVAEVVQASQAIIAKEQILLQQAAVDFQIIMGLGKEMM
jgi:hypothetical protein